MKDVCVDWCELTDCTGCVYDGASKEEREQGYLDMTRDYPALDLGEPIGWYSQRDLDQYAAGFADGQKKKSEEIIDCIDELIRKSNGMSYEIIQNLCNLKENLK